MIDPTSREKRPSRIVASGLIVLSVLLALWALGEALSIWVVVCVIFFGAVATEPRLGTGALRLIYAAVVALLAVTGFNVALGLLIAPLPDGLVDSNARLPIWFGLAVAVLIFWSTAYFYLRSSWLDAFPRTRERIAALPWVRNPQEWSKHWSLFASGVLATFVIIGLPPLITALREHDAGDPGALPTPTRLGAELDVRIIAPRPLPQSTEILPGPARAGFLPAYRRAVDLDVRFAVGFADGRNVRWTRVGMTNENETRTALSARGQLTVPAPERRAGSDAVVVLSVDATAPAVLDPASLGNVDGEKDEVEHWRSLAVALGMPKESVVALLQTTDEARLRRWAAFEDVGQVVSIQRLGSQTVTDAAVRLGVGRPTGADDYELAMRHRPILLFDANEPTPRPLSIEQLFKDGRVRQCDDLQAAGNCEGDPLKGPAELKSPGTHLVIDRPSGDLNELAHQELAAWREGAVALPDEASSQEPEDAPPDTSRSLLAIPGEPPESTPPSPLPRGEPYPVDGKLIGEHSRMYVNAVPVRDGTRHLLYLDYWWYLADNPTGAVKGAFCGAGMVILGVTCFDHESDWEGMTVVLERMGGRAKPIAAHYAQHESVVRYSWPTLRAFWNRDRALDDHFERLPDYADRPVVFVASGTHAGYARRCVRSCRQVAADLEERPHDGELPWTGDDTAVCLRVGCLLHLPTAAGGRGPASWNAFAGPWGSRRCWQRHYCDSATPPPAPGGQDRYRDPANYDGTGDIEDRSGFRPQG